MENGIQKISQRSLRKEELIEAINKTFPDLEFDSETIAYVVTTTMADGTKMQSVCFGKLLDLD